MRTSWWSKKWWEHHDGCIYTYGSTQTPPHLLVPNARSSWPVPQSDGDYSTRSQNPAFQLVQSRLLWQCTMVLASCWHDLCRTLAHKFIMAWSTYRYHRPSQHEAWFEPYLAQGSAYTTVPLASKASRLFLHQPRTFWAVIRCKHKEQNKKLAPRNHQLWLPSSSP